MNILDQFKLTGKKAFITGGARGIGKSIAMAFAQAGADVAIVDLDLDVAQQTAKELAQFSVNTLAVKTDVTKPDDVNAMMTTILNAFGSVDIVFNNAGICINVNAEEMTYEQWRKVIDINLNGVFLVAQAAGKAMIKQQRGSIINTASMSGHIVNEPQPQCAYNASKAAVIMLTKSLAAEWAPHHVRVNSLSPGYIGTEMTLKATQWIPLWEKRTPMGRMGKPDELQGIVLYLASDVSSYTTGSDFVVDGGFTCW
ncbi:short-chain dehydrogenase/reductase SDR [Candidatus Moduliflexus flocculans]|uniref:Short-chain dehydrogenase/reductase SDR n=1 Tax=Candidatus Moduliflexus flocculans TaxID=1499966 RepID=A0A0S6VPV0_9BACT|nr:short-chain dehydrogenase/reductase SDR [Candidatus Moduliflexus flocculans]